MTRVRVATVRGHAPIKSWPNRRIAVRGENQPGRQIATKAHNQIVTSPLVGHSEWFLSRTLYYQCPLAWCICDYR